MNKDLIKKFNIHHDDFDFENPLSCGNGNLCITLDQTGFHTFSKLYNHIPLSVFSNKVWAGKDINPEIKKDKYIKRNGEYIYHMTTDTDKENYDLLRTNFHKMSLFNIKLLNSDLDNTKIITQDLDLYSGILYSNFKINDDLYENKVYVTQDTDTILWNISGKEINLSISFNNPSFTKTGASDIFKNIILNNNEIIVKSDLFDYKLYINTNGKISLNDGILYISNNDNLTLEIGLDKPKNYELLNKYFDNIIDLNIPDNEILRRYILSLYLMKINTLGIYPPAETGLTCNSWYGKFHLEMHLWHHLGLIYLGAGNEVIKSMDYYLDILDSAKNRAKEHGYEGARYPKMTDFRGFDSPSPIGCLLMWQAPHIILMCKALKDEGFDISKYHNIIYEVAKFIKSVFIYKDGVYLLDKPLIPSQECYLPLDVESPLFETEYLRSGLILARDILNTSEFDEVIDNIVKPYIKDNVYQTDITDLDHFTTYAKDHPSVIGCYSYFKSERIDKDIMLKTLHKCLESFDLETMWGWDFSMMAMTAYNCGDFNLAIKLLKYNASKNQYLKNGHNKQSQRDDLPLYLPGNGSLLLACYKIFKD